MAQSPKHPASEHYFLASARHQAAAHHYLVETPFVATNGRAATNAIGEFPTELLGPATNCFMADDDPARGEYFFDHPQAQWKPKIQLYGIADHLAGEAMATIEWIAGMGHGSRIAIKSPAKG